MTPKQEMRLLFFCGWPLNFPICGSGVTLPVGAPPLSGKTLPPLKFFVSLKRKKKKKSRVLFFAPPGAKRVPQKVFSRQPNANLDREIHKQAVFSVRGLKIQENFAPLIRRPPAQRGLRGPKLRH